MIHICKVEEASELNLKVLDYWHFTCPVCKTRCRLQAGAADINCGHCKAPYKVSSRGHVYSGENSTSQSPEATEEPAKMYSELQIVQLETAKAKLAQETLTLNQMKARQESLINISKKLTETTSRASAVAKNVTLYIIIWPAAAIIVAAMNIAGSWLFLRNKLPLHKDANLLYQVGELAGYVHAPNLISIIITSTILAFFSIKEWKDLMPGAAVISFIIFGIWHFTQ